MSFQPSKEIEELFAALERKDQQRAGQIVQALAVSPEPARRAEVACLLGELPRQGRATDMLLHMSEREEDLRVLKLIGDALRKHAAADRARDLLGPLVVQRAGAADTRRALLDALVVDLARAAGLAEDDVRRLGEAHADWVRSQAPPAAAAAVVPRRTRRVKAITAQEVVAEAEGDEELSFSGVWGMRPQGLAKRPPPSVVPATTPAPPARAPRALALFASMCALTALVAYGPRALDPAADAPGGAARPAAGAALRGADGPREAPSAPAPNPVAAHLGPAGAAVALDGTVAGAHSGRLLVRCGGHHYIVRGRRGDELAAGAAFRATGRLAGRTGDGFFLLDL